MKKLSILIFLLVCLITTSAQSPKQGSKSAQLLVKGFSPDLYGKIYFEDTSEVFSKGWVAIYDQKTNKRVLKVEAEELAVNLPNGKTQANMGQLPYEEQSAIQYADFNFDGVKDLALEDGQNSCYHGPSFQVYMATKNGFALHTELTRLAQEYCGMFEVDEKKKQLHTVTKSGCCWHQYSDYIIKNNQPFAIRIEEEKYEPPIVLRTVDTWDGQKMTSRTFRKAALEEDLSQHLFHLPLRKTIKRCYCSVPRRSTYTICF